MVKMTQTAELKDFCRLAGADLAGIADLVPFKNGWPVIPQDLLSSYESAVSIAVRLDNSIISGIKNRPTPEYAEHYRKINALLNNIATDIVNWIAKRGFGAKAVPASLIVDEENLLGNISHKAIARMAGIGWQGKSLLIINPEYGPRIRLATVLTDMPLTHDQPLKNRCGTCSECSKACPASAIKNISTDSRYEKRDDALYFNRCAEKTMQFKTLPGIGARICGVCISACPFGSRK